MKLGIYSRKIWQIPNLRKFFPEYEIVFKTKADAIAGWGLKATADKARSNAARNNIPYIALEDGFLRSYDLGVNGAAPLSLVMDDIGIYYDASRPSKLEQLIAASDGRNNERAAKLISTIKSLHLSKYNCYQEDWVRPEGKLILLIDQCHNDESITRGMASQESFARMLDAARKENPGCKILIKLHPDVVSGKRQGCIDLSVLQDEILIKENINPHILFENVEKVYTVTSLAGFEALMHGLTVRCFGLPFYAGWGITLDEQTCTRRMKRKLEDIVAAAYFDYARYVNPYTGNVCQAEDIVEIIADLKNYYARHMQTYFCTGFSLWKRHFVRPYIKSPFNKVEFFRSDRKAIAAARENHGVIVVWAAREKDSLKQMVGDLPLYRMEDGFIRSSGLGSNFIAANSLCFDRSGIYFNAENESDFEIMMNRGVFSADELARADRLKELILKTSVSKYNTGISDAKLDIPAAKKIILAIGQVEGDASIRLGSPEVKTNQELIARIRTDNPDAFIIYKPHPEIVAGNRKGKLLVRGADVIISDISIHSLISKADEIHTITSLAGFEALIHEKKVVTYGLPFYAGWGLTLDMFKTARRKRVAHLNELIAAALIKYPSYFDFEAKLPSTVEMIIAKIGDRKITAKTSQLKRAINIMSAMLKS